MFNPCRAHHSNFRSLRCVSVPQQRHTIQCLGGAEALYRIEDSATILNAAIMPTAVIAEIRAADRIEGAIAVAAPCLPIRGIIAVRPIPGRPPWRRTKV